MSDPTSLLNLVTPAAALALFASTLPFPAASQAAPTPTGREIMELNAAQDRTRDSQVTVEMTLEDGRGRSRERVLIMWRKTRSDGTRMQLIRFQEPGDVEGTGFLQVENRERDDDLWLYLPALRRVRRISGTDRRDAFMGTDFTYEDLDPEDLDAHRYTWVRDDTLRGRPARVVEAEAVDPELREETAYGRRLLWVDRERHVLLRADLFDREGVLTKRLTADEIRRVAGTDRWRAHRLVMEDLLEGGRTLLRMGEWILDQGLSDDRFTERYLRRGG